MLKHICGFLVVDCADCEPFPDTVEQQSIHPMLGLLELHEFVELRHAGNGQADTKSYRHPKKVVEKKKRLIWVVPTCPV